MMLLMCLALELVRSKLCMTRGKEDYDGPIG
jgi:hypothetical protein